MVAHLIISTPCECGKHRIEVEVDVRMRWAVLDPEHVELCFATGANVFHWDERAYSKPQNYIIAEYIDAHADDLEGWANLAIDRKYSALN